MNSYNLIVLIQSVSIMVLALGTIYLVSNWKGKEYSYLVLFCIATMINNIGALIEIVSSTSDLILLGTKFSYVGKVFIPVTFFLFVMQYCEIVIPKKVQLILVLYHLSIAVLVFTYPIQNWFYTSVSFSTDGLFPHNNYGHGVMYNIYTVSLVLYFLVIFTVIVWILKKEKRKKRRIQMFYILISIIVAITGFVVFLMGITGGYDTTSLSYAICTIFMAIALGKYDLLDTVELARNYVIDSLSLGIIALDEDDRVIYHNEPLLELYPEFKDNKEEIVKQLIHAFENKDVVKIEDNIYRSNYRTLTQNGKNKGHIITIGDITDSYNYTQLMKKMTEIDTLTGLYNRFAYEYRILELKKEEKCPEPLIIFAMDVNGLKRVNDSEGHDVGDSMIYDAAQSILKGVGNTGECYRVGGDEFAAIITKEGINPDEVVQNIKAAAQACKNDKYTVSISIGYSMSGSDDGLQLEDMEKIADKQMYRDKEDYYLSKGISRRNQDKEIEIFCDSYFKVLKVNLETGDFEIIRMDIREKDSSLGFSRDMRSWLANFVRIGMVAKEDAQQFLQNTDPEVLKDIFHREEKKAVHVMYRRRCGDTYRSVMLEIVPARGYSQKQPFVYWGVKNI